MTTVNYYESEILNLFAALNYDQSNKITVTSHFYITPPGYLPNETNRGEVYLLLLSDSTVPNPCTLLFQQAE